MRRLLFPLIFGLIGAGVLISLGIWQVQRLAWKQGVLAEIDARIATEPVAIPATPDPVRDKYLPVEVEGDFTGDSIRVLASRKKGGAGYRIISVMETGATGATGAGRILIDRGFVGIDVTAFPPPVSDIKVIGNLHWPDEVDGFTPEPEYEAGLWFARDVPRMAEFLGTRPVLVVARETSETDPVVTPMRVDSAGIPNDHLHYAITWFSLAAVWIAMSGYFLWRMARPARGDER